MGCKCRFGLIKWGQTAAGTVRWRCPKCGLTRVRQKHGFRHQLLKRYLVDGDTLSQLSEKYHVHPLTIRNRLHKIFQNPPPISLPEPLTQPCWLMTDATHFKHWGCLLVTKATGIKQPLAVSFHHHEDQVSATAHLKPLSHLGVRGFTTDGRRGLVLAYKQVFPQAVQQRCLVHVYFKVQTLLTCHPKLPLGQDLLELVKLLHEVKDGLSATSWWELFSDWYQQHQNQINTRSHPLDDISKRHWWYTHKNLRKAVRHVLNAGDHLFTFLKYPNSVSHTNHLEGSFGQRKPSLYRHRGLSRTRVASVLLWTLYCLSKDRKTN